nr:putative ribonuclease H-like domain-containing protein [Tanacetum cinerariifolium]
SSPAWLFDIDSLTRTMNFQPVIAENQTNSHAGDVGAEDDINNMESIISTRSMARAVRDQGRISQMFNEDVHTCTIEEEVYVCQPPGFEDPENPDKVYKVVKALYGLHQAPRAWYETLATYLLENGFQRGTIDQTLFIKKQQKDILLV